MCGRIAAEMPGARLLCGYNSAAPEEKKDRQWVKINFLDPQIAKVAEDLDDVDTVVHLASLTPGNIKSGADTDYYRANVYGVMELLKALTSRKLKKVFYLSSSSVYNRTKGSNLDELSEKTHEDIYGLSKILFEREMEMLFAIKGVVSLGLRVPVLLTKGVKYNFLSKWKAAIADGQRLKIANPDAPFNAVCADFALFEAYRDFITSGSSCAVQNIFATQSTSLRAILDAVGYSTWDEVEAKMPGQTMSSLYPTLFFPGYSALEVVRDFLK